MSQFVLFGDPPANGWPRARGLFSSARADWRTPEALYATYVPPCFDVTDRHGGSYSGLHDDWPEPWWCNPPYNDLARWTARMGGRGVALLPVRTDTAWFHDHIWQRCRIEFIRGRLRFGGAKINAPFPSMLCHFGEISEITGGYRTILTRDDRPLPPLTVNGPWNGRVMAGEMVPDMQSL